MERVYRNPCTGARGLVGEIAPEVQAQVPETPGQWTYQLFSKY